MDFSLASSEDTTRCGNCQCARQENKKTVTEGARLANGTIDALPLVLLCELDHNKSVQTKPANPAYTGRYNT